MSLNFRKYFWNNLVALDQTVNTILGGDPDMTISGRMGRAIARDECFFCRIICRGLDIVDPGHCSRQNVNEADEGNDQIGRL